MRDTPNNKRTFLKEELKNWRTEELKKIIVRCYLARLCPLRCGTEWRNFPSFPPREHRASAPFGKISSFFQPRFFFLFPLCFSVFFFFFLSSSWKRRREKKREEKCISWWVYFIVFELVCCENNRGERVEVCKSLIRVVYKKCCFKMLEKRSISFRESPKK